MYIERQQLVEEIRLRNLIQQAIRIVESKKTIAEDAVGNTRDAPYDSTGLNTLNTLFDNILTQLEDGYKELATGKDQRDSFAAHILTNIVNTLAPLRALDDAAEISEDIDIDIDNKAKPATNIPVIAPDLKPIFKPAANPCLEASAVLTFA